ncbi:hypothetical protein DC522_23575 [Microvirga sp. KLBC 81]|nr:hypothetical protein DC522_23575 [Microvirga sp. KLBC 81]
MDEPVTDMPIDVVRGRPNSRVSGDTFSLMSEWLSRGDPVSRPLFPQTFGETDARSYLKCVRIPQKLYRHVEGKPIGFTRQTALHRDAAPLS